MKITDLTQKEIARIREIQSREPSREELIKRAKGFARDLRKVFTNNISYVGDTPKNVASTYASSLRTTLVELGICQDYYHILQVVANRPDNWREYLETLKPLYQELGI